MIMSLYYYKYLLFFLLILPRPSLFSFFFFNDTATTEIYTLSLHDALPIYHRAVAPGTRFLLEKLRPVCGLIWLVLMTGRSEEHTSELQSRLHLVCRLLLEKKKKNNITIYLLKKKRDMR